MYTMWSSEPDTIHYIQKNVKMIFRIRYFYIFFIMTHLRLINLSQYVPFLLLQRNLRRCNTSRSYDRCMFLDISLYCNPTALMCCPTLLPGCICRSAKIWQMILEDYHHLLKFSGIVLTRYPKFDCKLRVICNINIILHVNRCPKKRRGIVLSTDFDVVIRTIIHHNYLKQLKNHPYWNALRLQDLNVPAKS